MIHHTIGTCDTPETLYASKCCVLMTWYSILKHQVQLFNCVGGQFACFSTKYINPLYALPYSGKVWQGERLVNILYLSIWRKKVWWINSSAKGLLIVTTNLDSFSLANLRRFAKLSTHQTFPLYGIRNQVMQVNKLPALIAKLHNL